MKFNTLTAAVLAAALAILAAPQICAASDSTDAMATVTKAIMAAAMPNSHPNLVDSRFIPNPCNRARVPGSPVR